MTDLLDRETRTQPGDPASARPLTLDAGRRSTSSVFRFIRGCVYLLGYIMVSLVLGAALIELGSWAIWTIHPLTREAEWPNQRASPVYAGADWAHEFWQEESSRHKQPTVYVPFRLWSVKNWHGKYINNDPGVKGVWRRTINPVNCDSPHKIAVWTFGGSTMYGTAVPDWATIPTYLSRDLNVASHDCVVVSNFGVEGYVTDQELILLAEQVKAGGHPDIVIFYDGVNDSSLAWAPPGAPDPHFLFRTIKTRVEGSLSGRLDFLQKSYAVRLAGEGLARLHPSVSYEPLVAKAQPNVVAAVDNYEANMQLASSLGDVYKFKLYCFWQPILNSGHKPLVPFEQSMATRDASGRSAESAWFLTIAAAYKEAERRAVANGKFVFLGGLFDSTQEPLYVDEAHLGPRGNELAAKAIASYIQHHP